MIGFYLVELLNPMGTPNNPVFQAVAKTVDCSSQTDCKASLLKAKPTQLTEHGDIKVVPT